MARVKMSWDWVMDYPIFVYTTFIDHFKFHVKLVKGAKGDQNSSSVDRSPSAPAWKEYIQKGMISKDEVVQEAFRIAKKLLLEEGKNG